jgi:hypothetical protein
MRRRHRERPLVYFLVAVAFLVFAVGVIYLFTMPKDLPSFLPGHLSAKALPKKPPSPRPRHVAAPGATHRPTHVAAPVAKPPSRYSKRAAIAFVASAAIFFFAASQSWTWRRWKHYH